MGGSRHNGSFFPGKEAGRLFNLQWVQGLCLSVCALGKMGTKCCRQEAKYIQWNVQKRGKAPFVSCEAKDKGQQLE